MIRITVSDRDAADFQGEVYQKWGFAREEGNQMATALTQEEFEDFLKENNLILYKNHIKTYQEGKMFGEFSVD